MSLGNFTGVVNEFGSPHGIGFIVFMDNRCCGYRYEGLFFNGNITGGYGAYFTNNGDRHYEGQWLKGQAHGIGIFWDRDGGRGEGEFLYGAFIQGKKISPEGVVIYYSHTILPCTVRIN